MLIKNVKSFPEGTLFNEEINTVSGDSMDNENDKS